MDSRRSNPHHDSGFYLWMTLLIILAASSLTPLWAADAVTLAPEKPKAEKSVKSRPVNDAVSAPAAVSPQRIFLSLTAEPSTSQAVSWEMPADSAAPKAQIVPATGAPIDDDAATAVEASTGKVVYGDGQTMNFAGAVYTGLKPDTLYAYRVGDGKIWSEWNQFRTASAKPAPFRFLYIGDQQNDIKEQWSRVMREALMIAPDARFIVNAGDMVTDPSQNQLWDEWYEGAGWIYRAIPSVLSPGNHDMGHDGAQNTWRPQFTLPVNGPKGEEELSCYVDYQGVRIIALNSGSSANEEATLQWLNDVLANNPNTWTIVVTHKPVYSTGKDRDSSKRGEALVPLYDKYGVDLVLQGHDHSYGRTFKMRAGKIVKPDEPGVIYAVSVSGPKMYTLNAETRPLMSRMAAKLELFQVIAIDGNTLRYDAYTADGKLFDSFDLQQTASKATKLADRAPKDEYPRVEDFFVKSEKKSEKK